MIKNLRPKLCEQGKVKIGRLGDERTTKDGKSTYRLPNKLDHFLITTTEKDNTGNFIPNVPLMEEIAEVVDESADHLTTIPVYLLFDDIDSNFYTTYNCYKGKTRACAGDGEKAIVLATGEEIECPCSKLDRGYTGPTPCKPYGRLNVVLQNMDIVGGAWVYRTTGWNSVQDILGSLLLIQSRAGRLAGIPLMLKLFPKTTQLPRGPVTIYTVSLIYQGSFLALAEEAKNQPMIGHDQNLSPDQTITPEEAEEIREEFYTPETDEERAKADAGAVTEKTRETKKDKRPAEKKEPTAAELAKKTKQAEDVTSEKLEKAKAKAAAEKREKAKVKKEQEEARAAAAKEATEAKQETGNLSEEPPGEELPINEEEALDEEPTDFGWV